jgi:glycosyltransferase involved in cell wall biosynthesis
VYYCVADFTQLSPHVEQLQRIEKEIIALCDVVFTNCSQLASDFSRWNQNVHIFPFGVNLDAFPLEVDTSNDVASRNGHHQGVVQASVTMLKSLPKPLIGYVGGMHRHVDYKLLAEMALAKPEWSWVCVGTLQTPVNELIDLPNVHLLGQQPHAELIHFIRQFDVCIVPYMNSPYTGTVVPTKINEYLAVGKPVVSTDLPTVCEFNREHQILLTAAAYPKDFLHAIEQSLALPRDSAIIARRRQIAELGDWQARLQTMSNLIESQLEKTK